MGRWMKVEQLQQEEVVEGVAVEQEEIQGCQEFQEQTGTQCTLRKPCFHLHYARHLLKLLDYWTTMPCPLMELEYTKLLIR